MKKIYTWVRKHFELSIVILILAGIIVTAFLVYNKLSFLNFFFLPVILSGYFLGKREAILTASFCVVSVILYQFFMNFSQGHRWYPTLDELTSIISWASFLILTAAIIGILTEQKESRIKKMGRSYIGALKIMLKYFEVADEKKPHSLRVSHLSGKIAQTAGLNTTEVENIKSAALLHEAGDLQSSLLFFEEVVDFMSGDIKLSETQTIDKDQILLSTTASLLSVIEPLLSGYYQHYVKEADKLDKDLNEIPAGSSIIAIANLYDKIVIQVPASLGGVEIGSLEDIEGLSGRSFPDSFVRALKETVRAS
jgi:hypothetical protein